MFEVYDIYDCLVPVWRGYGWVAEKEIKQSSQEGEETEMSRRPLAESSLPGTGKKIGEKRNDKGGEVSED